MTKWEAVCNIAAPKDISPFPIWNAYTAMNHARSVMAHPIQTVLNVPWA